MTLRTLILCTFAAVCLPAQNQFAITNYQVVNQQQLSGAQLKITYRADLVNNGSTRTTVTAGLSSLSPNIQVVPGQNTLIFSPTGAQSQVTSQNTFTVLVSGATQVDFSQLQWTYLTPIANAGSNVTAQPGATITLNGTQSTNPSGAGSLTYYWTFASRPPGTSTVLYFVDSPTPFFTVDVPGAYILQLTVTNGYGSDTSTMTVNTANTLPVANAGPNQTVAVGSTVTLNGSGSTDVDGDPLSYSWMITAKPVGSSATLTGAGTIAPTFVVDKTGSYSVQLIASDGASNSVPATVVIATQNTPPVANAGLSQVVGVGNRVQLDGSKSTDVDGDPLTYSWSLITRPSGSAAGLSSTTAVNPTFGADVAGSYVAQLIVNDGFASSAPSTVSIATGVVQPPIANAGLNQTIAHNTTVTLQGVGADPQNMPLTYQWALMSKPTASTANLSIATSPNTTFFADKPGTYVAQLMVSNGVMPSSPSTVTITTSNSAPVANAGANQNVTVGMNVLLDGSRSMDPDHDSLRYSWSFTSRPTGSSALLTGATTIAPAFQADVAGTYVIQLIVNDGYSNSNPATVMVNAVSNNTGLNVPSSVAVPFGQPVRFPVTAGAPAPTGGIFVTLMSSDTSTVTVSPSFMLIPQYSTNPSVQPQLTGLKFGNATVTLYAAGFAPSTVSVSVGANITFSPQSLTLSSGSMQSIGMILSVPAPAGGLTFLLSSSNPQVATVPASIFVPGGASSVTVPVTAVSAGNATITASTNTPNIPSAGIGVTVPRPASIALPSTVSLGLSKSVSLPVLLSVPAPAGGLTVALNSSDVSKVTVAPSSVFIAAGATMPLTQPQVMLVSSGSATITAAAPGYGSGTSTIQVAMTLSFWPSTIKITGLVSQAVVLTASAPAPPSGLTVYPHSDNPSVATVQPSLSFPQNSPQVIMMISCVGYGSTVVHANAPGVPDTTISVTCAQN